MSEIYEGNSITVNNINKSKAKIKNRGGSYQEVTQGKQLFNKDNPDFSETGSNAKYVSIKNGFKIVCNKDKTTHSGSTFKIRLGSINDFIGTLRIKTTAIVSGNGTFRPGLALFYGNANNFSDSDKVAERDGNYGGTTNFDIESNITEQSDLTHLYLLVYGNSSGSAEHYMNNGDYTIYDNFIITLNNDDMTYEPYTGGVPTPSPDYPSEIKNVTGEINKYYIPNTGKIKSYGITATYTENTSEIILDGVATRDFSDGFEIKNILLKKGTYSVSVWGLNKINEEYDRFFVADTSNNNKVIVNYVQSYRTQEFTLEQDTNIRLSFIIKAGSTYSNTKVKIMINEGDIGLSYVPYNSFKIRQTGKNMLPDNRDDYNGSLYGYIKLLNNFGNNNLVLSIEDNDKSIDMTGIFFGVTGNGKNWDNLGIWLLKDGKKLENSISTNKYPFFSFYPNKQTTLDKIFKRYKIQAEISKGIVPTEFEKYKSNSWIFPLEPGQKLYEGSYLAEDGIHNVRKQVVLNGTENWRTIVEQKGENTTYFYMTKTDMKNASILKSDKFINRSVWGTDEEAIQSINDNYIRLRINTDRASTIDELKKWLAENPVVVEYELAQEEIIPYTQEQQNAFYQLQNIVLYDGINHISTDNELGSMSVEVSKIIEDYETYISSNGFFINSQNDIHYLIDFSESELPCMAEATETTVKAAGRNGDIVLSTTYDPNNFNIVCYTEDNLTQEEKVKEEMKLKKLLNSIKNKTIPLAFEKDDKFYKVKYSGAFSSTNFPKHLKFSIPLKTSESYGKDLIKKVIFGNGEEISDTFEDVGAIFTIKGPANSPIISLNDYSIEYDNPLLEGDKLIINSSNSTITHINSDGVATNAMRYYNHQFPKIENGKNVLKVLSGVNEANVSVEWYDYKF